MSGILHDLIAELRLGRIRTVAFVVRGDVRWTLPLYELALATARRGWSMGIADARYWFVTPEPVPLAGFGSAARAAVSARLEPEGITFVGSTFADLRPGAVLLDPQGECIEVDRVVTLVDRPEGPRVLHDRDPQCVEAGHRAGARHHVALSVLGARRALTSSTRSWGHTRGHNCQRAPGVLTGQSQSVRRTRGMVPRVPIRAESADLQALPMPEEGLEPPTRGL